MMNDTLLERVENAILLHEVFIIFLFVLQLFSKRLINVHLTAVGKNLV